MTFASLAIHPAPMPWFEDPAEIATLLEWMYETGTVTTVRETIAVIEKPWHYGSERDRMQDETTRRLAELLGASTA